MLICKVIAPVLRVSSAALANRVGNTSPSMTVGQAYCSSTLVKRLDLSRRERWQDAALADPFIRRLDNHSDSGT
jgi:hypothetical protein